MADRASGVFIDSTDYNGDTFDIGDMKWSARRTPGNTDHWYGPCVGQAISRSTYADLFAAIVPDLGAATVTIASPGVFTLASHGLVIGDRVFLTTTGALPTGLSANTIYYVVSTPTSSTFTLSASEGGSAINTSGSQSGTHHLFHCPYGLGDGSTTFNVPDTGGRSPVGAAGASGHADVRAGGQNEGVSLANRRPKHQTTNSLTASQAAHFHGPGQGDAFNTPTYGGGGSFNDTGAGPGNVSAANHGNTDSQTPTITLGGSIGTNNGNDAVDAPAYIAGYYFIKYA